MPQIILSKSSGQNNKVQSFFKKTNIMDTMKDNTAKRDKIFMILLIVSSVIVISANIAVNFFS